MCILWLLSAIPLSLKRYFDQFHDKTLAEISSFPHLSPSHDFFLQISSLITRASELKSSNLRLSKNLEEAMDRYDLLANQNTDLQNTLDSILVGFNFSYVVHLVIQSEYLLSDG